MADDYAPKIVVTGEVEPMGYVVADGKVVLENEVIPYKKYIRKVVELSTIKEINRWEDWRNDYHVGMILDDEIITPRPKQNRFLPWLILLGGIVIIYFWLGPQVMLEMHPWF